MSEEWSEGERERGLRSGKEREREVSEWSEGGEGERVRVGKWKGERGNNEMRQIKEGESKTVKNGVGKEGGSEGKKGSEGEMVKKADTYTQVNTTETLMILSDPTVIQIHRSSSKSMSVTSDLNSRNVARGVRLKIYDGWRKIKNAFKNCSSSSYENGII